VEPNDADEVTLCELTRNVFHLLFVATTEGDAVGRPQSIHGTNMLQTRFCLQAKRKSLLLGSLFYCFLSFVGTIWNNSSFRSFWSLFLPKWPSERLTEEQEAPRGDVWVQRWLTDLTYIVPVEMETDCCSVIKWQPIRYLQFKRWTSCKYIKK
jgi:hypothetical protein